MTIRDDVLCDWRKWPKTPYRTTPMLRLGEDEQGTWLFAPRGAAATYASDGAAPLPVSFLTLVPRGEHWWIATWMRDNDGIDIDLYVDIVHPPTWVEPDRLFIVDLDLDVIRRRGGEVLLDDEDELNLHTVTLQYPHEVVATARDTASTILSAVAAGDAPFGGPPALWLAAGRVAADRAR